MSIEVHGYSSLQFHVENDRNLLEFYYPWELHAFDK